MAAVIGLGVTSTGSTISAASPVKVTGTGTTYKVYGGSVTFGAQPSTNVASLPLPGSNRADSTEMVIRTAGTIFPNTASNHTLTVWANYGNFANGASQYPTASITSASMTNNVALYNGNNNFVVGQFVVVANIVNTNINGLIGPLQTANATAFTAANVNLATLAIANIANAAQTATAAIGPTPFYTSAASPTLTVNVSSPFFSTIDVYGDRGSGVVTGSGTDNTVNSNGTALVPNKSTGTIVPVPSVNFQVEPPLYLTVSSTFGVSDANNVGSLRQFELESS